LENCSHSEIRFAWRDYQLDSNNRSAKGRLIKPDAGAIRAIILRKRPKPEIVATPEPERPAPCAADVAQAIVEAAGYTPKKFGGA